jgi:hypothetical protein
MSVALTEDAVRNRSKTVTRRLGWKFLKPGDHLTLCRKVMGRKQDEPLVRIAEVEVLSVRSEQLWMIDEDDVEREGFTGGEFIEPSEFVYFFCEVMGCEPDTEVTRIKWRSLD